MSFTQPITRLKTFASLALVTMIASLGLSAGTAFAAQIQEEGEIYAGNVTQGVGFTHAGVSAKDGDTVAFEVYYHDLESPDSGMNAINVNIKASLPSGYSTTHTVGATVKANNSNQINDSTSVTTSDATQLQFIPGTVTWKHDTGTNASPNWVTQTISDSVVTGANGAIVDQNEQPSNNFSGTIVFQAKLVPQPPTPPAPVYTCDLLSLTAESDKTVKLTAFNTTAKNGATFANATIDWGDKSSPLTTSSVVGQTHKYSDFGTYTIAATANFNVNGATKSVTSVSCQKQVTFKENKPPVVVPPPSVTPPSTPSTPAAPTALVNTGAGNVAGLFAAVTAAGAVAYRWVTSRRLSRQ